MLNNDHMMKIILVNVLYYLLNMYMIEDQENEHVLLDELVLIDHQILMMVYQIFLHL
jgi:hypothetical protein